MPVPILPIMIGTGLGALLLVGKGGKAAPATMPGGSGVGPSSQPATPTQQSTGGINGGAQAPSHGDLEQTQEPAPITDPVGGGGGLTPNVGFGELGEALSKGFKDSYQGVQTGQEAAFSTPATPLNNMSVFQTKSSDPWATDNSSSFTKPLTPTTAGSSLGQIGGTTTRYVGDLFQKLGSDFGGVW